MQRSLSFLVISTVLALSILDISIVQPSHSISRRRSPDNGALSLCAQLIQPNGYPCTEHTIQTKDGYLLGLQRVSSSNANLKVQRGPPVLLLHGLFMGGDAWFLDSPEESLGFVLADHGFDVWVGNVRGTRWSHGHISLSENDKDFWDWSWQELALYDAAEMIHNINIITSSKIFIVGHSQGTIITLAALTQPDVVEMVEAAALLSPITYLEHISAPLVLRMVGVHLDQQMVFAMGLRELNFRSNVLIGLVDSLCDGHLDCNDLLTTITGKNCCFNNSRVDFYLEYEPHPSSAKNMRHLFQMIRKGTFSLYDYGFFKNLKLYGQTKPPAFDLSHIPKSLPLWMCYGGNDALADVTDVQHTIKELQSTPELLYLENYGHMDFILSIKAKEDFHSHMIGFFRSLGKSSSSEMIALYDM
ncbi:triacylglycerol lipase 1-like isoform X1 [Mangifera indica]|uniref:triacylglycerol lipase 1-like isoform X1 n=1 Tax=Mangifera indica TaxID=29780 RepID=UPI001CFADD73|nr:triacylglycerol lipase 1-like isoform X1 [Mangifera indica]XP_044481050.1 triacylglycerol lipase 1-like isoform X1 [Mangifera indica]